MLTYNVVYSNSCICMKESLPTSIVVTAAQVIWARFFVVDIATIAERVAYTKRVRQRSSRAQQLAPYIILVFYNKRASAVKNANDISLKILEVSIDIPVKVNLHWTALTIIEEVKFISMPNFVKVKIFHFHVGEQLTVICVVRGLRVPVVLEYLLDTHTIVIVLKRECLTIATHLFQLATCLPLVRPHTVVQRIADGIISNGSRPN